MAAARAAAGPPLVSLNTLQTGSVSVLLLLLSQYIQTPALTRVTRTRGPVLGRNPPGVFLLCAVMAKSRDEMS